MKPIFKSVLRMPSFKRDGDLTVAQIVEAVEEIDQTRISGISSNLLSSKSSSTQFQATKRWNKLITKFYEEMPKRKHRGLIFSYNDIFTGKEAIQFLITSLFPEVVPNKPVDETNAIKFMEVLLKKNLVENVKFPESQLFISKAIYRFLTVNIAAEMEATNLKRSNSNTNLKATSKFTSAFQQKSATNRRISSSCSNLHTLIKAESKIEANASQNPFMFSRILKPTQENADDELQSFSKNKAEKNYFMKQITCSRYSNPPVETEFLSSPSTSSTACSTIPSSTFSISTLSSSPRSVKRCAEFQDSDIPPKRFNRGFIPIDYNRTNECTTASRAEELLLLLDSHISDEMLTETQRERKLAAFRETYPQTYLIRFPEAAFTPKPHPRHQTPVRVIRNLIRRTSSKRK